mgnify:CR=1 FL=1
MRFLKILLIVLWMASTFTGCEHGTNIPVDSQSDQTNAAVNQQNADVQPQNQTLAATEPVKQNPANTQSAKAVENKIKVTFIELGSVNCIPCRMMQPVMKQIEEKYKDKVKIIFYDVWTQEGQPFGQKYGIQAIPTQIFLDKDGKEFFRHAGFFSFEECEKVFKTQSGF